MITSRRLVTAIAIALVATVGLGDAALAAGESPTPGAAEPVVPAQVADYFATGLVPRLAQLYAPGKKAGSALTFGDTTRVGAIHRVLAWTAAYRRGGSTTSPTELTNNWIATVSANSGEVLGEALVWINPADDLPELADFDLGTGLATALARAPQGRLILHDDARKAWLAVDGPAVTVLVPGTSGASGTTTAAAYQKLLSARSTGGAPAVNVGLLIAGVVLIVVVVLLALFVLLPDRRRRRGQADAAAAEGPERVSASPRQDGAGAPGSRQEQDAVAPANSPVDGDAPAASD